MKHLHQTPSFARENIHEQVFQAFEGGTEDAYCFAAFRKKFGYKAKHILRWSFVVLAGPLEGSHDG